jgi:hypothetical protein
MRYFPIVGIRLLSLAMSRTAAPDVQLFFRISSGGFAPQKRQPRKWRQPDNRPALFK